MLVIHHRVHNHNVSFAGDCGGIWFGLAVRERAGDDWQVVGRRRTLAELLTMVESRSTAFVECEPSREGVAFSQRERARYQTSTRPVGAR
jgi:hypothetical protein